MAEGGGTGLDILTDPVGNLVMRPAGITGAFLYDLVAPHIGMPRLTPEQRADLTGENAPPEQRGPGSILVSQTGKAIGADPGAVVPAGPTEAYARAGAQGATLGGAFSGGALLPTIAGAGGATGGNALASQLPDWMGPAANLATNVALQMPAARFSGGGAGAGSSIQPSDAATAIMARQKYNVPIDATDVTPGSPYRTPQSVQAKMDAWQGAMVRELGEDPNTPDVLSRNRITNDVMTNTATRSGQVMDNVANNTTIGPMQTYRMLQQIQQIENNIPTTGGFGPGDPAAVARNVAMVKNLIDPTTGQMNGTAARGLTRTNGLLDKMENSSNAEVAKVGGQLSDAVNQAFLSSASPQDAAALNQAMYQWRLMKTLQPVVAKAGGGNIDPAAFMTQVLNASRRFDPSTGGIAYTGGGNIGELARIGALIKNGPQPTPPPSLVQAITHPPAAGLGYVVNPLVAGGLHAAEVAARIGNILRGPYQRSAGYAARAFNNALTGPAPRGTWMSGIPRGLATGSNPLVTPTT